MGQRTKWASRETNKGQVPCKGAASIFGAYKCSPPSMAVRVLGVAASMPRFGQWYGPNSFILPPIYPPMIYQNCAIHGEIYALQHGIQGREDLVGMVNRMGLGENNYLFVV